MLQEAPQTTWDLQQIYRGPSTSVKIYVLFLLVVCIVTSVELFRAWRVAPPFRLSRQVGNPSYPKMLEASRTRLRQWILCTFLVLGILTSINLSDVCNLMLSEKTMGRELILFVLRDYGADLTMGFIAALFAFLVRWHFLTRVERLRE